MHLVNHRFADFSDSFDKIYSMSVQVFTKLRTHQILTHVNQQYKSLLPQELTLV